MTIKDLISSSGLSQAEFSSIYNIPRNILEGWKSGNENCPEYVLKLLSQSLSDNCKTFKIYETPLLMEELGICYRKLLFCLNNWRRKDCFHNPYPDADVFPVKYFTIILTTASKLGIPDELNQRIGLLMNFIDLDDWEKSMNLPSPPMSRMSFDIGMSSLK